MTDPSVMKAKAVCGRLARILPDNPGTGMIHSVFARAANIETDCGLVTLLAAGRCLQPNSVLLGEPFDFLSMGWRAGDPVRLSRAWIEIGETVRIDLMNAEKRDLSVSTIFADKRNYSRSFLRPEPIVSVLKEAGETNGLSNIATGM